MTPAPLPGSHRQTGRPAVGNRPCNRGSGSAKGRRRRRDETRRETGEREAPQSVPVRCTVLWHYSLRGGGHGTCGRKACGVVCGRPAGSGLTGPRPAAAKIGVARFAYADRLAVFLFSDGGGRGWFDGVVIVEICIFFFFFCGRCNTRSSPSVDVHPLKHHKPSKLKP